MKVPPVGHAEIKNIHINLTSYQNAALVGLVALLMAAWVVAVIWCVW